MGQEELALNDTRQTSDSALKPLRKRRQSLVSSRDEMNLAEFPLAVLSTRSNPKIKTLEFADTQRMPSGEFLERKWIITGADKFGLPTATDDDVVLGLVCLSMDQGFRDRKVFFTRYELLKVLRWSTEGKSYARLTKSLDRLSGVRIRATNAFYDNSLKAYQTRNFGLIDAYEINDERGVGKEPNSFFIWSEVIFESFSAGFIKKIDLDFYFKLKSAVSRRLYRYLDKHFYYKHTVEKSLTLLAFEKLGLSRNYKYTSSIKQQLKPACEELIASGFLADYEFSTRGGEPTLKFIRAPKNGEQLSNSSSTGMPRNPKAQAEAAGALDPRLQSLHQELSSRGLVEGQVSKLLHAKTTSEIKQIGTILRYYDHLVSSRDPRVSKNPVGFLYRAVESPFRFQVPASFGSKSNPETQALRPERRVISRHGVPKSTPEGQSRARYQSFVERSISSRYKSLGKEGLEGVRQEIKMRMSCLKSVLGEAKYKEAINGLVREEMIKQAGVPDFDSWRADLA